MDEHKICYKCKEVVTFCECSKSITDVEEYVIYLESQLKQRKSITNKQRNFIKKNILKCLTEDFKRNQAIFDKKEGYQIFNGTNLEMVMEKVVKGLEFSKNDKDE